jgi:hypothetical protein
MRSLRAAGIFSGYFRRLLDVPAVERRELAAAQGAPQQHFGGLDLGLSEQVARLFPGEPVPCPGAGLADTLERHDSLSNAAIEQPVLAASAVSLRIADSRRLMEAGARPIPGRSGYCRRSETDKMKEDSD